MLLKNKTCIGYIGYLLLPCNRPLINFAYLVSTNEKVINDQVPNTLDFSITTHVAIILSLALIAHSPLLKQKKINSYSLYFRKQQTHSLFIINNSNHLPNLKHKCYAMEKY